MNNIVYFAGVHGSGKSTLIKRLAEDDRHFFSYEKLEIPKAEGVVERNNIRLCRSYLQQFYQQHAAAAAPDKVLLCDRSWLDTAAYTRGFSSLGWFTPEQSEKERALETLLFNNSLPGKLVWVNPPYDWCHANLAKRWAKGERKWREEDERYHAAVHAAYATILGGSDGQGQGQGALKGDGGALGELRNAPEALLALTATNLDARVKEVRAWFGLEEKTNEGKGAVASASLAMAAAN
jgi:thymidylate kinase